MRWFLLAALLLPVVAACADIDLTTVPERTEAQIVVYGAQNLALVRDRRVIGFAQGANTLQFDWADTLIDPTSIKIRAVKEPQSVLIRRAVYPPERKNDLSWLVECIKPGDHLMEVSYFTSGISWQPRYRLIANPNETAATLLGSLQLTNQSGEEYKNAQIKLVIGELNMVEDIRALAEGSVPMPAAAPVTAEAFDRAERARGAMGPGIGMPGMGGAYGGGAGAAMGAPEAAPAVGVSGVAEHFVYDIEGAHDLGAGWRQQYAAVRSDTVRIRTLHRYSSGQGKMPPIKFYVFRNNEESGLGKGPLAPGALSALRAEPVGLVPIGDTSLGYAAMGQETEVWLGPDPLVLVDRKVMDYTRDKLGFDQWKNMTGFDTTETVRVTVRNRSPQPAWIEVIENLRQAAQEIELGRLSGEFQMENMRQQQVRANKVVQTASGLVFSWQLKTDEPFEKVDINTVKFKREVPSQQTATFEFVITKQFGSNIGED